LLPEAPHPHHVFTDPTGDFLLVPDLGADLIRINRIDRSTGALTEMLEALKCQDFREGVLSWMEKRAAQFTGR